MVCSRTKRIEKKVSFNPLVGEIPKGISPTFLFAFFSLFISISFETTSVTHTMKASLVLSGLIVNHDSVSRGSVVISRETGLIESVGEFDPNADIVNTHGFIVPGFVDIHVHARECPDHSQDYKETFETAEQAALNGGVVAIATMPNLPVLPTDNRSYNELLGLTFGRKITIVPYYAIAPGSSPLRRNVPVPGKAFLAESFGTLRFISEEQAEETLRHFGPGDHVSLHCDNEHILKAHQAEKLHEDKRPPQSEIAGITFAISLARKYGFSLKVVHVSTKQGLALVRNAKLAGVDVVCEGAPHHFMFDRNMITDENRPWRQMNPPLRTPDDRVAILHGLMCGDIDYLATDHAPHTKEEKQKVMSGLPMLDTYGAVVGWLVRHGGFDWPHAVRVASYNPGKWLRQFMPQRDGNIGHGHGAIAPGYIGSVAVIDMNRPMTIEEPWLKTRCGWSPFTGTRFPGTVTHTVVRGEILMEAT